MPKYITEMIKAPNGLEELKNLRCIVKLGNDITAGKNEFYVSHLFT